MNGHSETAIQETNGDEYEYEREMRQSLDQSVEFDEMARLQIVKDNDQP